MDVDTFFGQARSQKIPAQGASLEVRWIAGGGAAQKVALRTGEDGKAAACFPIPEDEREATLLVCSSGPEGRAVVKYYVLGNLSTDPLQTRGITPRRRQADYGE